MPLLVIWTPNWRKKLHVTNNLLRCWFILHFQTLYMPGTFCRRTIMWPWTKMRPAERPMNRFQLPRPLYPLPQPLILTMFPCKLHYTISNTHPHGSIEGYYGSRAWSLLPGFIVNQRFLVNALKILKIFGEKVFFFFFLKKFYFFGLFKLH